MAVRRMKVDLLPKGTDLAAVGDWVIQATIAKKLKYSTLQPFLSRCTQLLRGL